MDIMANMGFLHLWFDPVPAVFNAAVKDGSENGIVSPRSSPNCTHNQQYDGQWVEILTLPLSIPSDSQISGCLHVIRVVFSTIDWFPFQNLLDDSCRAKLWTHRNNSLGPHPGGFLCNSGTMAYHSFSIRMSDEESSSTEHRGRCVVISDEV